MCNEKMLWGLSDVRDSKMGFITTNLWVLIKHHYLSRVLVSVGRKLSYVLKGRPACPRACDATAWA